MYAVLETGGKQYRVSQGESIQVELLRAEPGTEVELDRVLALVREDATVFGNPYVPGASVSAEVLGSGKGPKVTVFKQKTRKGHRRLRGHRQGFTTVRIKEIKGGS